MSFDHKVFHTALIESIEALKTHPTTKPFLQKFSGGYVGVASNTGGLLYFSSVGFLAFSDAEIHRLHCLDRIRVLGEHLAWDLSREAGSLQNMTNAGAIRAWPYLFSFASLLPGELNELLMFMAVVKAGLMSKEIARDRLYHFPTKYAQANENDVWEIE